MSSRSPSQDPDLRFTRDKRRERRYRSRSRSRTRSRSRSPPRRKTRSPSPKKKSLPPPKQSPPTADAKMAPPQSVVMSRFTQLLGTNNDKPVIVYGPSLFKDAQKFLKQCKTKDKVASGPVLNRDMCELVRAIKCVTFVWPYPCVDSLSEVDNNIHVAWFQANITEHTRTLSSVQRHVFLKRPSTALEMLTSLTDAKEPDRALADAHVSSKYPFDVLNGLLLAKELSCEGLADAVIFFGVQHTSDRTPPEHQLVKFMCASGLRETSRWWAKPDHDAKFPRDSSTYSSFFTNVGGTWSMVSVVETFQVWPKTNGSLHILIEPGWRLVNLNDGVAVNKATWH